MNQEYRLNCTDRILSEALEEQNKDYSLLLLASWGFHYLDNIQLPLWERIMPYNNESRKYAFQCCGIKIVTLNPCLRDTLKIIETQLEKGKTVIVSIDIFYCKWHKGYNKSHFKHHISVTEVCYEKNCLACDDPYFEKYNVMLDFLEYEKGMDEVKIYELDESMSYTSDKDIIEAVLMLLNTNCEMFHMIKGFACAFSKLKSWNELFDYKYDVYLCSLPRVLKFIIDARINMGIFLKEQGKKINLTQEEISRVSDLFFTLAERWGKINNSIIKIYFKQSINMKLLSRIEEELCSISETESELHKSIRCIYHSYL